MSRLASCLSPLSNTCFYPGKRKNQRLPGYFVSCSNPNFVLYLKTNVHYIYIGVEISRAKRIGFPLLLCLVLGIVVTIAKPDLQVLARQLPTVPDMTLIFSVALGTGFFLVMAQARMFLNIPLSYTLIFFYGVVFVLSYFAPNSFIPVAFDSGGVTTSPITVPFIMSLGIGMASIRSDKNSSNDFFGLIRQYEQFKLFHHFQTTGLGTAASHLLDTLGFGTTERDVVLSLAPEDTVEQLMYFLKDDDRAALGTPGIAFSMKTLGMTAILAVALSHLEEMEPERGERLMELDHQHSLILVAVNQGYTDAVMDTARASGARGGTVIRARWTGAETIEKFAGITLQAEKALLAIVTPQKDRNAIMSEINRLHGMKSAPQAVVISLPIAHMARLD